MQTVSTSEGSVIFSIPVRIYDSFPKIICDSGLVKTYKQFIFIDNLFSLSQEYSTVDWELLTGLPAGLSSTKFTKFSTKFTLPF